MISLALNRAIGSRPIMMSVCRGPFALGTGRPDCSSDFYNLCDRLHVQVPVLKHADLCRSAVCY